MVNHLQFYKITQIPKDVSPVFIQGGQKFYADDPGPFIPKMSLEPAFFFGFFVRILSICRHFL